ncbi:MAG: TIR domain-containing protein [bacterium]
MVKETKANTSYAFDVFISYASVDKEPIELLVKKLKLDGFRVWFDAEQIARGPTTLGQLADGIANSSHMIVCLSDAYIEREFTNFELQTNQSFDPANKSNRTIPVKIRPMTKPVPTPIQALNYGDLTDVSKYDSEYQKITRLIRRDISKPEPTELDRETLQHKCEAPFKYPDEPNVALFQVRIATEALCKFLHRQEMGEPPPNSALDSLIQRLLSVEKFPPPIKMSLGIVQTYGNFVVKDQIDDYVITQESIQPGLAALRVLSDWTFATYFDQPEQKYIWDSVWAQLPKRENINEREIPGSKYIIRSPRLSLNSLGPLFAGYNKIWHQSIAVNLVALSEAQEAAFFEEVSQFIRLNDASIVRPLDAGKVIVDEKRLCLYVILEHVDGVSAQSLAERFGVLPALAACELCRGVAVSLEGLHASASPIVHGDIKPANIMVDRYGTIKVLCIGRSTSITTEDASSGAAGGKIDSFLFASPEQLSGVQNLTPKTDIFALRATLFYLLTGEYEARIRGSELPTKLPPAAAEALEKLVDCTSAKDARNILELACQKLADSGVKLRIVVDCYHEGKDLSEASVTQSPPTRIQPQDFSLLAEFTVGCRDAWPLGNRYVLIWENGADTLAILEETERLWRDSHPMRIRRVSYGPGDQVAIASWEGQIRCFTDGAIAASINLDGAIGDVQFCGDRWLAGTWKHSLVSIKTNGELIRLLDVEKGVFRIAVKDDAIWFAVADLGGGISLYMGDKRVVNIPPLGVISSMAFAGRRLMTISGELLIAVGLDGKVESRENQPGGGSARLLPSPSPGHCLLLSENGNSWLIDETGTHLPYFTFPPEHVLFSYCRIPNRFILALPQGGFAYWRDGKQKQNWLDAIAANLSSDGHFIAVTFPEKVQLYEDPI